MNTNDENLNTIELFVDYSSNGQRVYEEVPVLLLENEQYKILKSPGILLGLAKDDIIKLGLKKGEYSLLQRGENICVQLYKSKNENINNLNISEIVINSLNGTLDGVKNKLLVFTIPLSVGFASIEKVFNEYIDNNPGSEWYYGNIYSEDGFTPLNWWIKNKD